jgi:hypothetical protein
MDRLAEAWIAPRQVRELRELTRYLIRGFQDRKLRIPRSDLSQTRP